MADLVRQQLEGVPRTMRSRYRDMGDGTHALVVSADIHGALTVVEPVTVDGTVNVVQPVTVAARLIDEAGAAYGVPNVNGKPRVSSMPYTYDIAEGNVPDHIAWSKIGYTPAMNTVESDIWSAGTTYIPPTAEMQMEVVSSNNVDDIGTTIKTGNATGGSLTTLEDTGTNFTAATAVAIGDTVLINKAATAPQFGVVTAVAPTVLTVAGGFSRGLAVAAGNTYHVLDYSATLGAQAVQLCYLDDDFVNGCEIVILNGTTVIPTVKTNLYRVNAFRVVAAGANGKPTGTLDVRNLANTPIYGRITAGFTRGRNSFYTVPAGRRLYITEFTIAYGYSTNQTHYARLYTRATQFENTIGDVFRTPGLFYPYTEVVEANTSQLVMLNMPKAFLAGVDIKVSGVATFAGVATVALRGWLETD